MQTLIDMLTYRRPAGSRSERKFINRFIRPLGVEQDGFGNLIKRIGTAPILWSAHTDTVHREQGGRQTVGVSEGFAYVSDGSSCLGADNGVGVFLLTEMIKAGVEGLYIFHREEETGCRGSNYIAQHTPELVAGMKAAIAFDRRNISSIITHQFSGRTASDTFCRSLRDVLDLGQSLDDGGTYTDTNEYVDLISECTNVSAGFYNEHSAREYVDLEYVEQLRDRLLSADFGALVFERIPGTGGYDYGNLYGTTKTRKEYDWPGHRSACDLIEDEEIYEMSTGGSYLRQNDSPSLRDLILDHPEVVEDLLEQAGVDRHGLLTAIYAAGGSMRRAAA